LGGYSVSFLQRVEFLILFSFCAARCVQLDGAYTVIQKLQIPFEWKNISGIYYIREIALHSDFIFGIRVLPEKTKINNDNDEFGWTSNRQALSLIPKDEVGTMMLKSMLPEIFLVHIYRKR